MDLTLHIWRQTDGKSAGALETYSVTDVTPEMSFIEMLNKVNRELEAQGAVPVAFECDCLEGICGTCSLTINGRAHGPESGTTSCQLHMRSFKDGDHITIEPFRAAPFPVMKDLIVDRSAFDRIVQAGGFISAKTGGTPDANAILVAKNDADEAMNAAECIGCGACVASCKNGSAMLFTAAKVSHLGSLPQGQPERYSRVLKMVETMDEEGFGNCTNQYECEASCPKGISVRFIARLNRDYLKANIFHKK